MVNSLTVNLSSAVCVSECQFPWWKHQRMDILLAPLNCFNQASHIAFHHESLQLGTVNSPGQSWGQWVSVCLQNKTGQEDPCAKQLLLVTFMVLDIFFCYNKLSQSNLVFKIFCRRVRYFLSLPVVCSYGHDLEFDYVTFLAFREEKQANANQIYSQAVLSIAI